MKTFLAALMALLWIVSCAHSPSPEKTAQKTVNDADNEAERPPLADGLKALMDKGLERYRRSDFAGAIQEWEPVWIAAGGAEDNWTPTLLYYCYLSTGQYKKALTLAEDNLKKKPHNPLGYQQVGIAQLWLGKNSEAEDTLRKSAEFDSHSPDVFFYLGIALQRQGRKSDAEKQFSLGETEYLAILEQNPHDFPANYGLAYSYLYRNTKIDEAMKLVTNARESLKQNPDVDLTPDKSLYAGFYLPLLEAMYLNRQNKSKESNDRLLAALQNSPSGARADLAEVYYFMGRNLKEMGQIDPSKDFLAKSLELNPHGPYSKMK